MVSNYFSAYRLDPGGAAESGPPLELQWRESGRRRITYLPNVAGAEFIFLPKWRGAALDLSVARLRPEKLDWIASLSARLRGLSIKRNKVLDFKDFRIVVGGPKPSRRVAVATIKYLRKLGTPLDGETIRQRPELILGWGPGGVALPARPEPPRETSARIAVALHLYYADLWPEIRAVLMSLPLAFDLIVTTVADREELIGEIRADFPEATIHVLENRGRDVGPFLVLLEEGALDRYDCVCKIHGKKTLHGLKRNPYGEVWRRRLLFDLLCADRTMARAVERFERNPSLGLLGPEAFRVAGAENADFFWKDNRERVSQLLLRLGNAPERIEPDFFAGTMFWVRPQALAPLRALRLSREFEADQGKTDGTLEHAVERTIASVVKIAGYQVETIDGLRPAKSAPLASGAAQGGDR
ncbi:MAG: rhamnan synthesis F family protein [Roseiarcus sp.]